MITFTIRFLYVFISYMPFALISLEFNHFVYATYLSIQYNANLVQNHYDNVTDTKPVQM